MVNRTQSKAGTIAAEIRRRFPKLKVQLDYPRGEVDLLVNATSLGLSSSDPLPVDGKQFSLRQARTVYDMIYRPAETPLMQAARIAGCQTANGLGMLLYQGAKALEIWTGATAPIDVMRRALEANIYG
jgi:shikimate dehydrogenase